jgi:hypothetical protein
MSPNRVYRLTALALAAVGGCGLLVAAAVQIDVSRAANDKSDASARGAVRGRVVIDCEGGRRTMPPPPPARGRCTVSGAITDRGKFVDDAILRVQPHGRTFFGAKGTIWFSVYERGHWRIIDGTKAYAGLRGRGWESPPRNRESTGPCPPIGCPFDFTMTGTVSSDARGTSGSALLERRVQIHVTGIHTGPQPSRHQPTRIAHGRFALSGALSDRGTFEDYLRLNVGRVRTLFGAKGTIAIAFVGPSPTWRIEKGTRAYAGLRGRGKGRGPHSPGRFEITMVGRVSQ